MHFLSAPLFATATTIEQVNQLLMPLALVAAIVSYVRRKDEIGGWLSYFYFWIVAVLVRLLLDVLLHPQVFLRVGGLTTATHLALIMTTFPRLLSVFAVVVTAFALLARREWVCVERLRTYLVVTLVTAGISVALDIRYFPSAAFTNVAQWFGLLLWTFYFYESGRVHEVFRTKGWKRLHPSESGTPTHAETVKAGESGETK